MIAKEDRKKDKNLTPFDKLCFFYNFEDDEIIKIAEENYRNLKNIDSLITIWEILLKIYEIEKEYSLLLNYSLDNFEYEITRLLEIKKFTYNPSFSIYFDNENPQLQKMKKKLCKKNNSLYTKTFEEKYKQIEGFIDSDFYSYCQKLYKLSSVESIYPYIQFINISRIIKKLEQSNENIINFSRTIHSIYRFDDLKVYLADINNLNSLKDEMYKLISKIDDKPVKEKLLTNLLIEIEKVVDRINNPNKIN